VRLARVRGGELLALAGAVCVIVSLFVRSYEGRKGALDAWATFGLGVVLLLLAALMSIALLVLTLFERSAALPVAAEVTLIPLGIAAAIAALVRVLERPDGATMTCVGVWLALAGAVAIFAGAWRSTHDERCSLYPPALPPPRPRP
jgi:hypothetical protein